MKRTLNLKRESLTELTSDELAGMAGAIPPPTPVVLTLPLNHCIVFATVTSCATLNTCLCG
jgi:hypothetical protein